MKQPKYVQSQFVLTRGAYSKISNIDRLLALLIHKLRKQLSNRRNKFQNKTANQFVDYRFTSLSAKRDLTVVLGKKYREIILEAEALGLINIFRSKENVESYSQRKKASFSKKYTVNDEIWNQIKNREFITICLHIPNPALTHKYGSHKSNGKVKNKFLIIKNNLDQLIIADEVFSDPDFDYLESNSYVRSFFTKKHLISDGDPDAMDEEKTGRIYHDVMCMKKALRKYIRHVGGKPLLIIDASAMNPILLASEIEDWKERYRWLKICMSGNFYTDLVGVDKIEKNEWKTPFMEAMSSKDLKHNEKVQQIRTVIQRDFPSLHAALQKIHKSGMTVARKLGKIETKIFRSTFKTENRFHVSMHDGLLISKEDLVYFNDAIQDAAKIIIGYPLLLKVETLAGDVIGEGAKIHARTICVNEGYDTSMTLKQIAA